MMCQYDLDFDLFSQKMAHVTRRACCGIY